eukprot:TCONS_00053439-protein
MSSWAALFLFSLLTGITILYCAFQLYPAGTRFVSRNRALVQDDSSRDFIPNPVQQQRLNYLRHFCQAKRKKDGGTSLRTFIQQRFLEREQKGHIFVSRVLPVLYCAVPKVASTNWKRMLLLFDGIKSNISEMGVKSKVHTQRGLRPLYHVKGHAMPKVIKDSFKFMFVRHPFERLASAYRNKFADNNTYFEKTYGSRILKMFRKDLSKEEYNRGRGATFQEFVRWIVQVEPYDPHWYPATKLCHPCQIRYNFIGKMESLLRDAKEVVRRVDSVHKFPKTWTDGYKVSSNDLMFHLFSTLDEKDILGIYKYYKEDFDAFDYGLPRIQHSYNNKNNLLLRTLKKILNGKLT